MVDEPKGQDPLQGLLGEQKAQPASAAASVELKEPAGGKTGAPLDMGFILDIPLKVSVEVGRTKLLVQELLQLGQGSVIELDKQMGEPFEVLVNEKLVARGEIVVVNDRFGVRLTDIISTAERVQTLG
jgi:flagellar motor switch protein FliN/FliY